MWHEKVVLAAGGTGGHVIPAIALAQDLEGLNLKVELLHDNRVKHIVQKHRKIKAHQLFFAHGAPCCRNIAKLVMTLLNTLYLLLLFSFQRPRMVVGFGGYVSAPALIAAKFLLISIAIVEQNSVLGSVNRAFCKHAKAVFTAFESVARLPDDVKNMPIAMIANPDLYSARNLKTNKDDVINLLVTGGSQGASSFAEFIPAALEKLSPKIIKRINLTLQVPEKLIGETESRLKGLKMISYEVKPFFYNMISKISGADLIIARGGASTIAEICASEKAYNLRPMKCAKDNHQYFNIKILAGRNAALLIEEDENLVSGLEYWISELVHDAKARMNLARNAAKLYSPINLHMMALLINKSVRNKAL